MQSPLAGPTCCLEVEVGAWDNTEDDEANYLHNEISPPQPGLQASTPLPATITAPPKPRFKFPFHPPLSKPAKTMPVSAVSTPPPPPKKPLGYEIVRNHDVFGQQPTSAISMLLSSVPGAAIRTGQRGSKSRLKPRATWQHDTWKEILTRLATQRPLSLGLLHLPHSARDDNLRPLSGEDIGSEHLGMSRRPIIARRDDGERCPARVALHLGRIGLGPSAKASRAGRYGWRMSH